MSSLVEGFVSRNRINRKRLGPWRSLWDHPRRLSSFASWWGLYCFSPFGHKTIFGDLDMRPHPETLGTTLYEGSHHHLIGKGHRDRELSRTPCSQ